MRNYNKNNLQEYNIPRIDSAKAYRRSFQDLYYGSLDPKEHYVICRHRLGIIRCNFNRFDYRIDEVEGDADLSQNKLTSLEGIVPVVRGELNLNGNRITSLVGIANHIKYCRRICITKNPIVEGGIGLLMIEGLQSSNINSGTWSDSFGNLVTTEASRAFDIIQKYIPKGKVGILQCQEELIEENLEQFARL